MRTKLEPAETAGGPSDRVIAARSDKVVRSNKE
jgi:hypothetical protein